MLIARQSQPDSSDGEMARFGFCAAPSLVFFFLGGGGRGGGGIICPRVKDCNLRRVTMRMTKN